MAGNVTINVQGRGGAGGNSPQQPDNGNRPPITPDPTGRVSTSDATRLIDTLRQAVIEQAGGYAPSHRPSNLYTPLVSQVGEQYREQMNADITARYDAERSRLDKRTYKKYEEIEKEIEAEIARESRGITDPEKLQEIKDTYYAKQRGLEFQYQKDVAFPEKQDIARKEAEERVQSEDELNRTIKELTEQIRRSGGELNPNSYLNQLRTQRQQAIVERDAAEDEKTARDAAQKVKELDAQIKDVESGGSSDNDDDDEGNVDWGARAIRLMGAGNQFISSMAGGNFAGMLGGITNSIGALLPTDDEGSALATAAMGIIPVLGGLLQAEASRSDRISPLAMLMNTDPTWKGRDLRQTNQFLQTNLAGYTPWFGEASITDIGIDNSEFAQIAAERIKQRGNAQYGVSEAYAQIMLEHALSLGEGTLGQAGYYDRYGITGTNAIMDLVRRLERRSNSGITEGNYARMGEYASLQQTLMQQQMGFTQSPSFGVANKEIEAFASLGNGYTVDNRTAGHMQSLRQGVVNPGNDRMKAILYSTVEQLHPEAVGRPDLIERYINDEKMQGEIIRAYAQRIEQMYGSTDTTQGYYAWKAAFPGIEVGNIDAISKGLRHGAMGEILASGNVGGQTQGIDLDFQRLTEPLKGYSSEVTKLMINVSENVFEVIDTLSPAVGLLNDIVDGLGSVMRKVKNLMTDFY